MVDSIATAAEMPAMAKVLDDSGLISGAGLTDVTRVVVFDPVNEVDGEPLVDWTAVLEDAVVGAGLLTVFTVFEAMASQI